MKKATIDKPKNIKDFSEILITRLYEKGEWFDEQLPSNRELTHEEDIMYQVFHSAIQYSVDIVSELEKECKDIRPKRCSGRMLYQCGYRDGQKAGLQQGHDIIEKLLKEHQSKMDKLLTYEGERIV